MTETVDTNKLSAPNDSVWLRTLKLTLNILSHALICFVLLVCLCFANSSTKFGIMQLHIVVCVLGYQFFMCQGILVLTKLNSWSIYIKRRHRRNIHWCFEIIGAILILVGTIEIIKIKNVSFNTTHGILGLCALITTLISVLNGLATMLATRFTYHINVATASKWTHAATGLGTIFLSAGSLHYGFDKQSFKNWIGNENFIIGLKVFTWLSTIIVGIEFWTTTYQRIKYRIHLSNTQGSKYDIL